MAPARIDYGQPPSADQIEVTLFGPGFGEAVAVHVGCDRWILVDSCISSESASPASAEYLNRIGVGTGSVRAIVASHWHDDHVRGMAALTKAFPEAPFYYPAVLNDKLADAFLAAYSGAQSSGLSRGTKELYESFMARATSTVGVKNRVEVFHERGQPIPVHAVAFSPTEPAFAQFLAHISAYVPRENGDMPINHAPELSPNLASIVLHVEVPDGAILLGADLERHATAGWEAIVSDAWCVARSKAALWKVAHHGSASGDHPEVWDKLLEAEPVALLSPFNNGRHSLPTSTDRARILQRTQRAFITSKASRRPRLPQEQLKRLKDICTDVTLAQPGFGAVRARRRIGETVWTIELFGMASELKETG